MQNLLNKLKSVDITFWYRPTFKEDSPTYELGNLCHEAAEEIEKLTAALKVISNLDLFDEKNMPTGVGEAVLIAKNALLKESKQ